MSELLLAHAETIVAAASMGKIIFFKSSLVLSKGDGSASRRCTSACKLQRADFCRISVKIKDFGISVVAAVTAPCRTLFKVRYTS